MSHKHHIEQGKPGTKKHILQFSFIRNSKVGTSVGSLRRELGAGRGWGRLEVPAVLRSFSRRHQAAFNISVLCILDLDNHFIKRAKVIKRSKSIPLQRRAGSGAVAKMAGRGAVHRPSADLSLG